MEKEDYEKQLKVENVVGGSIQIPSLHPEIEKQVLRAS